MNLFIRFLFCLSFLLASAQAFQPPCFAAPKVSFKTQVHAVQVSELRPSNRATFSEPRTSGRAAFLGIMIGRVSNRIVDFFLSDECKETNFPSTVLQAVFLIGAMDILSGNRSSKDPSDN
mmetsp:Transcript_18219/g.30222  ORF Transcript_18219/g.30222 Transcript_18219/m.30222 type:complete len:120 (-) Transcript_18219:131-490(-)|eukprot:CAMPEP_0119032522 /NCGR_PEP_ID=MMETSP1176-20130426/42090_1 /TAXON_ID=265551 /ORGANISM="Synedropsis recta cf, Strain CCMP1620" /LENGTH=119 /DNA_ID=CAMNT_0006988935 /DNA_START=190 /DNA_END=549 /DNA_ORIENTATION=+